MHINVTYIIVHKLLNIDIFIINYIYNIEYEVCLYKIIK